MSNVGRWDQWYVDLTDPEPYDDTTTYGIGADWLADCETVEDWGTGRGWFKTLRPDAVGIDGSKTPHADVTADLAEYRSTVDGVFMRGVAEHDFRWRQIIENAWSSATERMALVVFTPEPESGDVEQVGWTDGLNVPDLAIPSAHIDRLVSDAAVCVKRTLETATQYGVERVWLLAR